MSVEDIVTKLAESASNQLADGQLHERYVNSYKAAVIPTKKDEAWKYLSIDKLFDSTYALPSSNDAPAELIEKHRIGGSDSPLLVFVNGIYNPALSNTDSSDIIVLDMQTAKAEHAELYSKYFGKTELGFKNKIESMNAAYAQNGSFIYLKPGKAYEKSIQLLHIVTADTVSIAQIRNLIVAGAGSIAKIAETHVSENDSKLFTNSATELIVEQDANIEFNSLFNVSESDVEINSISVQQYQSSVFTGNCIMLSGKILRNNLKVEHCAEGCETNLHGLYFAKGSEHFDNYTEVLHNKPNCTTTEVYKGLAGDKATGVFVGNIVVAKDAQQTLANQKNQNILLSESATIHSKPQLEIWADDVSCSHGSTTGQLDKDQLFYMEARGIDRDKATTLLLRAFLADVSERLTIPEFREKVEALIEAKM